MGSGNTKTIKLEYAERPNNNEEGEIKVNKKNTEENNNEEIKKENNSQEENILRDSTIPEKKITVIIPLTIGTWEKSYNIETTLNKIASDFKQENNMSNIQKNFFIEFSFQNNPIDMDETPLKSLVNEDTTTIHIAQEIKSVPGTDNLDENIDIVGKPFSDPFQIFTFEIKEKTIKTILFNADKIKEQKLDKFGIDSAYCNGNNYLYLSGGQDKATNEIIGLFWEIDLKNKLFSPPVKIFPKKNHSMIYIEKKVYIIGGDSVYSMFYDTDTKEIKQISNLNYKRFEPSLITHDNYLFCFDTSKKYTNNFENIFNFERIDLYTESAQWELINPNISPNALNLVFSQKFFGVVEDFRQNIIFVGGIYDNDNDNDKNKEDNISNIERMNIQYNINKNMIEKSDIEYKDISFSEKAFYPFNNITYYIIPNFNKRSPKIIYFYKDKNIIEIKSYHHKKKLNLVKISSIKQSFEGLNLNMEKSDDINLSKKSLPNNIDEEIKISNKDNNLTSHFVPGLEEKKDINIPNLNNSNDTIKEIDENNEINNHKNDLEKSEEDDKNNINNEEKKTNIEEIPPDNNKDIEPKNEENNLNNKSDNDINKEKNILNTDIKQSRNLIKSFYIEKPEVFITNYHPSIDVQSKYTIPISNTYIKKNRMRRINPPIKINIKDLKKRIKNIKKSEIKKFGKNKNY